MSLRKAIIRLAHGKPELRGDLLPLLKQGATLSQAAKSVGAPIGLFKALYQMSSRGLRPLYWTKKPDQLRKAIALGWVKSVGRGQVAVTKEGFLLLKAAGKSDATRQAIKDYEYLLRMYQSMVSALAPLSGHQRIEKSKELQYNGLNRNLNSYDPKWDPSLPIPDLQKSISILSRYV